MNPFYKGEYVTVHDVNGKEVELWMTPYIVREYIDFIQERDRIAAKHKELMLGIETTRHLWATIEAHVPEGIPDTVPLDGLIDAFVELNFGNETVVAGEKRKSPEIENEKLLSFIFDFLINQGHSRSEIMAYPMPEFIGYQKAINDRFAKMYGDDKNIKKTNKDPLAGIPIRNN